jgi:hypothetical protein
MRSTGEFSQAFFQGGDRAVPAGQHLKDIVLSDAQVRDQAIRHFSGRAQWAALDHRQGLAAVRYPS